MISATCGGIGAVQTFSNRHLTVGLDGIVEMSEEDAVCLIPAGWINLADGAGPAPLRKSPTTPVFPIAVVTS